MKGILGRKLGMTQIFDPETGGVTAVTVIEAGPCPVTHVRSEAADGYTAVQLAYEPVVDRKITKGELGHLKKAGTTAHRHLAEFRGDTELDRRRHGHRRGVRARRRDQGRRHVDRQGLRRHDQAAQLQARPRQPRLAQRARARLDRRLGDSVPRVPGTEDVGPHGRRARHPARARRPPGGRRAQPAARQGRRSGPEERHRRDQEHRLMAALKAECPRRLRRQERHARGGRLRRRAQEAHRARGRARGAERASRGHPWRQDPWARLRRPRQAVAPEGHRPGPPGHDPRPALHGRRRRVRAGHAQLRRQGEPQGAPRRARRRALEPRRQRDARARRRHGLRDAVDQAGQGARREVGQGDAARRRRARGRDRPDQVVPQPRPRARHRSVRARGRADRLGALGARQRGSARRSSKGRHREPRRRAHRPGRVREELLRSRRPQVHVQGAPGRPQDAGAPGRRAAVRRQGRERPHDQGAGEAEAPRRLQAASVPGWKKAIVQLHEGQTIEIFEGAQV